MANMTDTGPNDDLDEQIYQAQLRLEELQARRELDDLVRRRDGIERPRNSPPRRTRERTSTAQDIVPQSPPLPVTSPDKSLPIARVMKRKAEKAIPGELQACFRLTNEQPDSSSSMGPDRRRKRTNIACVECQLQHKRCSHEVRERPGSSHKASDLDIFAEPFEITIRHHVKVMTYRADDFPLIDADGHFRNESGMDWHLRSLAVHKAPHLAAGSALLSALDVLSTRKTVLTIVKAGTGSKYLTVLSWLISMCGCLRMQYAQAENSESLKCALLSAFLTSLRKDVATAVKHHRKRDDHTIVPNVAVRKLPDEYLTFVALKFSDCFTMDFVVERYFRGCEEQWDIGFDWWKQVSMKLSYLPDGGILEAVKAVPDSGTRSGLWQMALHASHVVDDFATIRSLLQYDKSLVDEHPQSILRTLVRHLGHATTDMTPSTSQIPADTGNSELNKLHFHPTHLEDLLADLLVLSSERADFELVGYLLDTGANPNCVSINQESPLQAAVRANDESIVLLLLQSGASAEPQLDELGCPLQTAASHNYCNMICLLIEAGADIDGRSKPACNALYCAAENGRDEVVEVLIRAGADVNYSCGGGNYAVVAAAYAGRCNAVRLLVNAGADIVCEYSSRGPALHVAARRGHQDVVAFLIGAGVDVNGKYEQETAIQLAAENGHAEVVELLVAAGADTHSEFPEPDYGLALAREHARALGEIYGSNKRGDDVYIKMPGLESRSRRKR